MRPGAAELPTGRAGSRGRTCRWRETEQWVDAGRQAAAEGDGTPAGRWPLAALQAPGAVSGIALFFMFYI